MFKDVPVMFENMRADLTTGLKRLSRLAIARRFMRQEKGAAALEFGLILLPFLTLVFVIIETAIIFLAGQTLETAVADSARLIMTGQAQSQNFDQNSFKNAVCKRIYALFDCSGGMYVDVKTYASFANITNTVQFDGSGKPITTYQPGNASDIVVVRLMYQWPVLVPLVQPYLGDSGGKTRLLVATAAFRNEPY